MSAAPFPFSFAIVVGDGASLRTIHPAGLGAHRASVEAALADVLGLLPRDTAGEPDRGTQIACTPPPTSAGPRREPADRITAAAYSDFVGSARILLNEAANEANFGPRLEMIAQPPRRATIDTMTQREIATVSGYSGDACQSCGSFAMKRTGVCLTCEACGSTSGGCS